MSSAAISAFSAPGIDASLPLITQLGVAAPAQAGQANFQSILASGMDAVDQKIATADDLVRQFAVDDSIPVHQVTLALEEARLAVELAMQVRARLVETYREFMNMQL
jgi:flagellar hook-basal body complex protein FliE